MLLLYVKAWLMRWKLHVGWIGTMLLITNSENTGVCSTLYSSVCFIL